MKARFLILLLLALFCLFAEDNDSLEVEQMSEEDSLAAMMDTLNIEELYKEAAKWQVGSAIKSVAAAREELIERGEEALDYIFFEKFAYTSGLEDRATKATVEALLEDAEWRIYECLGDNPVGYLATAVTYIGDMKLEEGYDSLIAMLDDTTEDRRKLRTTVIRALGDFGNPDAAEYLHPFLDDTLEYRRITTAAALGKLKNPKSIDYLIENMDDSLFTVRQAITLALPHFGRDALRKVNRAYQQTDSYKLRLDYIRTMSRFRDDERRAYRYLRSISRSDDRSIRGHALLGMKTLFPDKVERRFNRLMKKEDDPFVRWVLELEE